MKRKAALVVAGVLTSAVVGAVFGYQHVRRADELSRQEVFADLSQCLLGAPVTSPDEASATLERRQSEVWHLAGSATLPEAADAWPGRCGSASKTLLDRVRESAFLDADAKVELMKELDALSEELQKPNAKRAYLARNALAVWRAAAKANQAMAPSSSVPGPAAIRRLDGPFKSPWKVLTPIFGGTDWAFLSEEGDNPGQVSLCAHEEGAFRCGPRFTAAESLVLPLSNVAHSRRGVFWDHPDYVAVFDDGYPAVLHRGVTHKIQAQTFNFYVNAKGTAYILTFPDPDAPGRAELWVKPLNGALRRQVLKASVGSEDLDFSSATVLIGSSIIHQSSDGLVEIPFDEEGKLGAVAAVGSLTGPLLGCRSEGGTVVRTEGGFYFKQPEKPWSPLVASPGSELDCAPSFVRDGAGDLCTALGCSALLTEQDEAPFRDQSVTWSAAPLGPSKVLMTWTRGSLMMRTRARASSDWQDVALGNDVVDDRRGLGIFADRHGALIVREPPEGKHASVIAVSVDGEPSPVTVVRAD